jgi:hypothetical protein
VNNQHPVTPSVRPPQTVPQQPTVNVVVNQTSSHQGGSNTNGTLERNHLVAILLAIFVGWLGIDRFYLGNPGIGLLKFFTFGLGGILWVVDIIMIATKSIKGITWEDK